MLSTGFSENLPLIVSLLALGMALGAVWSARNVYKRALELGIWVKQHAESSKSADLERTLMELCDTVSSLEASHKRLRSKYSMRETRERRKNGQDDQSQAELDDEAKAGLKKRLRLQAKRDGLLR